jgi:hypothetical protein
MLNRRLAICLTLAACGSNGNGDGSDGGRSIDGALLDAAFLDDGGRPLDAGPGFLDGGGDGILDSGTATGGDASTIAPGPADELASATGCAGIFNPDQVLRFELTMSGGDWTSLKNDLTNSIYYPAQLRCGSEAAVSVGVRRKRSGGTDKPGLKIDIDKVVDNQYWHGLRKLSLENGISEGGTTASVQDVMAEFVAWRIMVLSGARSGRAAFVEVAVNGSVVGTYTNVEVVDKRFLRSRGMDDSGWLFKRSGGDDGYKTNELTANPYEETFCFMRKTAPCATPTDLQTWLPAHLDIDQMIRFGGANALIANSDAPLGKDNNYYFYDLATGRTYFPWDLDSTMRTTDQGFFRGVLSGGVDFYWDVLYSYWEGRYDDIWTGLLDGALTLQVINAEIDRAVSVGAAKLEGDPALSGNAASVGADLKSWWANRHPAVKAELAAH